MRLNDTGTSNSFRTIAITHTTMDEKIAIPLYDEHLHFLLLRSSWRIIKIRGNYTFELKNFKKEFVMINQVSRQKAQTDVKKEFYKLIHNANFSYDSCSNADKCYFSPIYDEINCRMQKGTRIFLIKVLATLFHLKLSKDILRKNF